MEVRPLIVLVAGCYSPAAASECTVSCDDVCPAGLTCGGDHMCKRPGASDCTAPGGDGSTHCYGRYGKNAGNALFEACFDDPPTSLTLTSFDTNACTGPGFLIVPQPGGPEVCVRYAQTIVVGSDVEVTGTRPLAVVATGTLDITGTLSVASHVSGSIGAGADYQMCAFSNGANVAGVAPEVGCASRSRALPR